MIHPTAIIHSSAKIGEGVDIGPDTVIDKNVWIGGGTKIGARVVIGAGIRIGKACEILEFAKVGEGSSSYKGRKILLTMGNENTVGECVILDRGTGKGNGKTTIGDGNLFMANTRVGPDCMIGNQIVIAIGATLAGQNSVGDHVVIGGLAAVDPSYRIGAYALVTASTRVSRDIPPYMLASGSRARLFGPNTAALANHGFSKELLMALKRAYYILFRSGLPLKQGMKKLGEERLSQIREVRHILQFIQSSKVTSKTTLRRSHRA